MGKALIIVIAVVVVVAAAAYLLVFAKPPPAKLLVTSQPVEVFRGSWGAASDGMELRQGDRARTGEGGKATILWFDSSVTRLDENTEIAIDELVAAGNRSVSLNQSSGKTWNRVLVASGLTGYEVKTPTAVASVRGTGFAITTDEESTIQVKDGGVEVASIDPETGEELDSALVEANESAIVEAGDAEIEEGPLVDDAWIDSNEAADEELFEDVERRLLERYGYLFDLAGVPDAQAEEYVEDYVRGEATISDAVEEGLVGEESLALIPEELKYEPAFEEAGAGEGTASEMAEEPPVEAENIMTETGNVTEVVTDMNVSAEITEPNVSADAYVTEEIVTAQEPVTNAPVDNTTSAATSDITAADKAALA